MGFNTDKKALIVIDMQSQFLTGEYVKATIGSTIKACVREIEDAKNRNDIVVVVEFISCGRTEPSIRKALKGYKYGFVARKLQWDGSKEILQCLEQNNLKPNHFLISGIYSDICVSRTIKGLAANTTFKIDIIHDACNGNVDYYDTYDPYQGADLLSNVRVVYNPTDSNLKDASV